MKKRFVWILAIAACLLLTACGKTSQPAASSSPAASNSTQSQEADPVVKEAWRPSSAVTLIVPSSAGGGHDVTARLWAKCAEKYAGVPINVVNETAGGGVVAMTTVMAADTDGLTIGQGSISLNTDQYLVEGATYTPDDFTYVGLDATDANYLVVSADGPFQDMDAKQFLEYAAANPGTVRIGVSGNWTNHDYTRYLIEQTSGASFTRVSIKGGANIVLGILGGDLEAGVPYPSEISAQVEAGTLKILALTGNTRSPFWPDVPTFSELGYDINLAMWRAIILPKDTPQEIVDGWTEIYELTMNDPETIQAYEDAGVTYVNLSGNEAVKEYVDASHEVYKAIIDSGVVNS